MNWVIRTLMGAVVAGIGWKLGADAYESVKKRFQQHFDTSEKNQDEGAGATHTHTVDLSDEPPPSSENAL